MGGRKNTKRGGRGGGGGWEDGDDTAGNRNFGQSAQNANKRGKKHQKNKSNHQGFSTGCFGAGSPGDSINESDTFVNDNGSSFTEGGNNFQQGSVFGGSNEPGFGNNANINFSNGFGGNQGEEGRNNNEAGRFDNGGVGFNNVRSRHASVSSQYGENGFDNNDAGFGNGSDGFGNGGAGFNNARSRNASVSSHVSQQGEDGFHNDAVGFGNGGAGFNNGRSRHASVSSHVSRQGEDGFNNNDAGGFDAGGAGFDAGGAGFDVGGAGFDAGGAGLDAGGAGFGNGGVGFNNARSRHASASSYVSRRSAVGEFGGSHFGNQREEFGSRNNFGSGGQGFTGSQNIANQGESFRGSQNNFGIGGQGFDGSQNNFDNGSQGLNGYDNQTAGFRVSQNNLENEAEGFGGSQNNFGNAYEAQDSQGFGAAGYDANRQDFGRGDPEENFGGTGRQKFMGNVEDGQEEDADGFDQQLPMRSITNEGKFASTRLSKLSIHTNNDEFVLVGGHPPADGRASVQSARSNCSRKSMMRSTDYLACQEEFRRNSQRSRNQSLKSNQAMSQDEININDPDFSEEVFENTTSGVGDFLSARDGMASAAGSRMGSAAGSRISLSHGQFHTASSRSVSRASENQFAPDYLTETGTDVPSSRAGSQRHLGSTASVNRHADGHFGGSQAFNTDPSQMNTRSGSRFNNARRCSVSRADVNNVADFGNPRIIAKATSCYPMPRSDMNPDGTIHVPVERRSESVANVRSGFGSNVGMELGREVVIESAQGPTFGAVGSERSVRSRTASLKSGNEDYDVGFGDDVVIESNDVIVDSSEAHMMPRAPRSRTVSGRSDVGFNSNAGFGQCQNEDFHQTNSNAFADDDEIALELDSQPNQFDERLNIAEDGSQHLDPAHQNSGRASSRQSNFDERLNIAEDGSQHLDPAHQNSGRPSRASSRQSNVGSTSHGDGFLCAKEGFGGQNRLSRSRQSVAGSRCSNQFQQDDFGAETMRSCATSQRAVNDFGSHHNMDGMRSRTASFGGGDQDGDLNEATACPFTGDDGNSNFGMSNAASRQSVNTGIGESETNWNSAGQHEISHSHQSRAASRTSVNTGIGGSEANWNPAGLRENSHSRQQSRAVSRTSVNTGIGGSEANSNYAAQHEISRSRQQSRAASQTSVNTGFAQETDTGFGSHAQLPSSGFLAPNMNARRQSMSRQSLAGNVPDITVTAPSEEQLVQKENFDNISIGRQSGVGRRAVSQVSIGNNSHVHSTQNSITKQDNKSVASVGDFTNCRNDQVLGGSQYLGGNSRAPSQISIGQGSTTNRSFGGSQQLRGRSRTTSQASARSDKVVIETAWKCNENENGSYMGSRVELAPAGPRSRTASCNSMRSITGHDTTEEHLRQARMNSRVDLVVGDEKVSRNSSRISINDLHNGVRTGSQRSLATANSAGTSHQSHDKVLFANRPELYSHPDEEYGVDADGEPYRPTSEHEATPPAAKVRSRVDLAEISQPALLESSQPTTLNRSDAPQPRSRTISVHSRQAPSRPVSRQPSINEVPHPLIVTNALTPHAVSHRHEVAEPSPAMVDRTCVERAEYEQLRWQQRPQCAEIAIQTGETIAKRQGVNIGELVQSSLDESNQSGREKNEPMQPHRPTMNNSFEKNGHPAAHVLTSMLQQRAVQSQSQTSSQSQSSHQVTVIHNPQAPSLPAQVPNKTSVPIIVRSAQKTEPYRAMFSTTTQGPYSSRTSTTWNTRSENIEHESADGSNNDNDRRWQSAALRKVITRDETEQMRQKVLVESREGLPATPRSRNEDSSYQRLSQRESAERHSAGRPHGTRLFQGGDVPASPVDQESNSSSSFKWEVRDPKSGPSAVRRGIDARWDVKKKTGETVRIHVKPGKIRSLAAAFDQNANCREREQQLLVLRSQTRERRVSEPSIAGDKENDLDQSLCKDDSMIDHHAVYGDLRRTEGNHANERRYYEQENRAQMQNRLSSGDWENRQQYAWKNVMDGAVLVGNSDSLSIDSQVEQRRTSTPMDLVPDRSHHMASAFGRVPSIRSTTTNAEVEQGDERNQYGGVRSSTYMPSSDGHRRNFSSSSTTVRTAVDVCDVAPNIIAPSVPALSRQNSRRNSSVNGDFDAIVMQRHPSDHEDSVMYSQIQRPSGTSNSQSGVSRRSSVRTVQRFPNIVEEDVKEIDTLFGFVQDHEDEVMVDGDGYAEVRRQTRSLPQGAQPPTHRPLRHSVSTYREMQRQYRLAPMRSPPRFSPVRAPNVTELAGYNKYRSRGPMSSSTPMDSPVTGVGEEHHSISTISVGSPSARRYHYQDQITALEQQRRDVDIQIAQKTKDLVQIRKKGTTHMEVLALREQLLLNHRSKLILREVKRLREIASMHRPPAPNDEPKCCMEISGLLVVLNQNFCSRRTINQVPFAFMVMLKSGTEVAASDVVYLGSERPTQNWIEVPDVFTFRSLPLSFFLMVEVYAMPVPVERSTDSCASNIANKCRNLLTSRRREDPSVGSWERVGWTRLSRDSKGGMQVYLDDVRHPLEGTIEFTVVGSEPELEIKHAAFLTMYSTVGGMVSWVRYWVTLQNGLMYFYRYPEDESTGKPAEAMLDVMAKCRQKSPLQPCSVEECPRQHSFGLDVEHETPERRTTKKLLLSADTRQQLIEWLNVLNDTLYQVGKLPQPV